VKILLVSWYFPPTQTMGAIRVGKLAKYLHECGHEVRVLTARDPGYAQTSRIEIPAERIHATGWADVNAVPRSVAHAIRRVIPRKQSPQPLPRMGSASATGTDLPPAARQAEPGRLGKIYVDLVNFPDERIGWMPFAARGGRRLLRSWKPDVIFGSGPPITSLLIADRLAQADNTPCVLEFRDRWIEDPYGLPPRWRQKREKALQDRLVNRAAGIVTVSEPWAEDYRNTYGRPTVVAYNGFDPADYTAEFPRGRTDDPNLLEIVYTGIIYPGFRDPAPLFEAISQLGSDAPVQVTFYATNPDHVMPIARHFGVENHVTVRPAIPHAEAAAVQENADVLLLMQWNNPREQGNVPGKLFEYLGARRPILVMGLPDGVPARIIVDANAGFFGNEPSDIARQLTRWLETKRQSGYLEPLAANVAARYERGRQFDHLAGFLRECATIGAAGSSQSPVGDGTAPNAAGTL
jgi:hypothetical protein